MLYNIFCKKGEGKMKLISDDSFFISNGSNSIITQDCDKNLMSGDLVVNDVEKLKKIRDHLMRYSIDNYKVSQQSFKVLDSYNVSKLPMREEDRLIFNQLVYSPIFRGNMSDSSYCSREMYQSNYLNTILIATSLLGNLDGSNLDNIAQYFIATGIIRYLPIEQIWTLSSKNMYKDFSQANVDLFKFCELLQKGIISYKVDKKVSKEELNRREVVLKLTNSKQIEINSNILLGENSAFIKRKLK